MEIKFIAEHVITELPASQPLAQRLGILTLPKSEGMTKPVEYDRHLVNAICRASRLELQPLGV